MQGQRAVVTAPGQVALEAFAPTTPAPKQVLLRALTTLISPGTERAFFLNLENTNPAHPLYPGYSLVGEVIACGDEVVGLGVGDRVVCPARHMSHTTVDAGICLKVPDILSNEEAAFFNLLAIAMQGVRKARIELGESMAVLGAGVIGILAMRLAQLSGGLPVIGIDLDEKRLELARRIGADAVIVSDTCLMSRMRDELSSDGAAVVIEATGVPALVVSAFQLAVAKGRVILLGSTRGDTERINFYRDVHRKGLQVIGSHEITRPLHENSPGYWTQIREHAVCLELLSRGRVNVGPLITHQYRWQDFAKAYAQLANWDQAAMGIIIQWT